MKTATRQRSFDTLIAFVLLALAAGNVGAAEPEFPELTGRVVDNADMISPVVQATLEQKLAEYETGSSEQIVVVTLPSLKGYDIADYGYQLGRHWGIGQEGEDNGALLIVAKAEKKFRIEVGYGLEGRLTDATSRRIIEEVLRPAFQRGRFAEGIDGAVDAMISVLGGKSLPVAENTADRSKPSVSAIAAILLVMMAIALIGGGGRGGRGRGARQVLAGGVLGAGLGRGGFGGGFGGSGGGGFGGGGGGFGGGGASGGW